VKFQRAALIPAAAVASLLSLTPAAHAATIESQVPCVRVVPGLKSFPVLATGFPAGAFVTFKANGSTVGIGQADAAGAFDNAANPFFPPRLGDAENLKTVQLTAEDGQGTIAGPVAVPVARVTVVVPARARPRKRVRFRVFGFQESAPVYLHVRRKGTTRGRFSLGTTSAPCGTVTKRMRFMPLRNYRTGTYRYYFSHSRAFDEDQVIFAGKVQIYRTFRSPTASAQATAISG
jgi:hypothetical protein